MSRYVRDGVWKEVEKKVSTYQRVRKEEGKEEFEQALAQIAGLTRHSPLVGKTAIVTNSPVTLTPGRASKVVSLQFFTIYES